MEGLKYDSDKLRWDLLPIECIEDVVKILTFGSKKYAPNNWQHLEGAEERYYAALMRHLSAWRQGEKIDPESGLSHLAHVMCNIIFLLWYEKDKVKTDEAVLDQQTGYIDLGLKFLRRKVTGTHAENVVNE